MIKQLETPLYENIISNFEITTLQTDSEPLKAIRESAFEHFKNTGFPSIKNEEWRFTNILPYLKSNYQFEPANITLEDDLFCNTEKQLNAHIAKMHEVIANQNDEVYQLVLVNGVINTALSILPKETKFTLIPLLAATEKEGFQKYFAKIAKENKEGFLALNTALFKDGYYIEVPEGTHIDKPLHIVHVLLSKENSFLQSRNLVIVHKNAYLDVLETIIADEQEHEILINNVTEVSVAAQAHFHHYGIQSVRKGIRMISRIEVAQAIHSNYSNYTFTFPGSDLVRNDLDIHLDDKEVESHLYGLYIGGANQIIDNHTEVHHKFPHGESTQLYKGVLLDNAKAVFNGKIFVYEDAQKTNAFQQSNNILFTDKATINAKPQLEIYADDVKCSHGTTIGQLNDDAIFYLQTRGIAEDTAKRIMVKAFAYDVTEQIKIAPLKAYLESLIDQALEA